MNSAPHEHAEAHGQHTAYVRPVSGADPPGTSPAASEANDKPIPAGAALLVVKRGPNAGARFLLDRDSTLAECADAANNTDQLHAWLSEHGWRLDPEPLCPNERR